MCSYLSSRLADKEDKLERETFCSMLLLVPPSHDSLSFVHLCLIQLIQSVLEKYSLSIM
jgi:hypothetical protein